MKGGLLAWFIINLPFPFMETLGHGTKCISICFGMIFLSMIMALIIKYMFYKVVAIAYGYNMLTANDELYLTDYPVNPINIVGVIRYKKEKGKPIDWKKMGEKYLDVTLNPPAQRMFEIVVKKWGKYFLRRATPEEWKNHYCKTNFGIIDDITSKEELHEFGVKIKLVVTHNPGDMPFHAFLCPNFSEDEFAMIL